MKMRDAIVIAGARKRQSDGWLVVDARVARTGVQVYRGHEVGKPDMDTVRVYRPGSEVFHPDSMASFAHRAVTIEHPSKPVTAENWKEVAVGQTADEIKGEAIFLRVPLTVSDAEAIRIVEGGKRELSAGYTADLDWTSGETEAGEHYDAIQRNIRANHIAIVDAGRAGSQVRIGDDAGTWGIAPLTDAEAKDSDKMADKLRVVMVDGLSVETTDLGAQAIEKLQKKITDMESATATAAAAHEKALAAKDAEIAKKDASIEDLKAKALDAAAIDKMVADRAALVASAKKIAPKLDPKGLSDAEIRKAAVVAALGDKVVEGKGEAYIDARFEVLVEDAEAKGPAGKGSDKIAGAVLASRQTDAAASGEWSDGVFNAAGIRMKKE